MSPTPLFIYGTLRDPDILQAVLGRHVPPAALPVATAEGYKTVYYPGQVYPALVPASGHAATGALLENLTAAEMAALDAYEGDEYRRVTIVVHTAAGDATALTYLPSRTIAGEAPSWTLETWTATHKPIVLAREAEAARTARQTSQN